MTRPSGYPDRSGAYDPMPTPGASGTVLTSTGTTTDPTWQDPASATGTLGPIYGGGTDGAFDLDGTNTYASYFTKSGSQYTALVDVKGTTIRVRNGAILLPAQFWLYAETSFTVDTGGIVRTPGISATGGTAGAAIAVAGTLQTNGGMGAVGRTSNAVGLQGTATNNTIGGAGGAGGAVSGAAGGAASPAGTILATSQSLGTPFFRASHRILAVSTATSPGGGCGGSSGGAILYTGTATSGAGGGGASAIRINARAFTNAGTVSCNGGNGGNAAVTGDAVAGGGAGGGGGFVGIQCDTYTNTGTIQCLGGTGGTGAGTGATAGASGAAGRVQIVTPTGTTNL